MLSYNLNNIDGSLNRKDGKENRLKIVCLVYYIPFIAFILLNYVANIKWNNFRYTKISKYLKLFANYSLLLYYI